jgi:hypothetical protein
MSESPTREPDPIRRECLLGDGVALSPLPPRRRRKQEKTTSFKDESLSVFEQYRLEEQFDDDIQKAIELSLCEEEHRHDEQEASMKRQRYGLVRSRLDPHDLIEAQWISFLDWECTPVYRRERDTQPYIDWNEAFRWLDKRKHSSVYNILFDFFDKKN